MTSSELSYLDLLSTPTQHVMHVESDGLTGMTVGCHHCSYVAVGVTTVPDLMAIIDQHCGPIASDG